MRRRARYEAQVDTDVPSYKHTPVSACGDPGSDKVVDILYNSMYSANGLYKYHRNNYCVLPLSVPSLSLNKTKPFIPKSVGTPPSISSNIDIEYDYHILVTNMLDLMGIVGSDLTDKINRLDACGCIGNGPTHESTDESMAPLDSLTTIINNISDEYAYNWEDNWDMATLPTFSPRRSKKPGQSSSSSSTSCVMINAVYLGKVLSPSVGAGGISIVSINDHGGDDGSGGSSYPVNFPAI